MDTLSQQKITEYSEAFSMYDEEGEGQVKLDKMGPILQTLGLEPFPMWLQTLQRQRLDEGEDTVDYLEFLTLMATNQTSLQRVQVNETERIDALREAFAEFDVEYTGMINVENVRKTLLSVDMPEADVERLIALADPGSTGHIKYDEFAEQIVF